MAGRSRSLIFKFAADEEQYQRGLRNVEKGMGGLATNVEKQNRRVARSTSAMHASISKGAVVAAGATGLLYEALEKGKGAIETTTELAHTTLILHKNLGLATDTASKWAAVASSRGMDPSKLAQGFGTLSKQLTAANAGSAKSTALFKALGLTTADLQSKNFDRTLGKIADGWQKMPAGPQKTAASMTLFGKSWQQLTPLLAEGSKGIDKQIGLADKYHAAFSQKGAKDVEKLIEKQRELKIAQTGLELQFTQKMAPGLLKVENAGLRVAAILGDPKLTSQQKWEKLSKLVGHLATQLEGGVEAALPHIASAIGREAPHAAEAFVHAFVNADAWGKVAIGALILKKSGGLSLAGKTAASLVAKGAGGAAGGGGGIAGLRGLTPETPMYVAVVNPGGLPGGGKGGLLKDAEKVAGGGAGARFLPALGAGSVGAATAVAYAGLMAFPSSTSAHDTNATAGARKLSLQSNARLLPHAESLGDPHDPRFGGGAGIPDWKDLQKYDDVVKRVGQDMAKLSPRQADELRAAVNRLSKDGFDGLGKLRGQIGQFANEHGFRSKVLPVIHDVDQAYADLASHGKSHLSDIKQAVVQNTADIKHSLSGQKGETQALGRNYEDAAKAVARAMGDGSVSVQTGTRLMNSYLQKALSEYGLKYTGPSINSIHSSATTQKGHTGVGAARGYIGNPGERGHDMVPLMVGRGEAILNRHQQGPVDTALRRTYGFGLGGLFARERRPHYMAAGGYAAMVAKANEIDGHHYNYEWGGGHGAGFAPGHGSGHGSGPGIGYDCSGAVSAVLHAGGLLGAPLTSGPLASYGMPGSGLVTVFANDTHTYMRMGGRYFGTSNANPGGGAGWFDGAPRPGFAVRHVAASSPKLPRVSIGSGLGQVDSLGQGQLDVQRSKDQGLLNALFAGGGRMGGGDPREKKAGGGFAGGIPRAKIPAFMQSVWGRVGPMMGDKYGMPKIAIGGDMATYHAKGVGSGRAYADMEWDTNTVRISPDMVRDLASHSSSDPGSGHNWALLSAVHEFAHAYQGLGLNHNELEGGADLFAHWAAPGVYSKLGIPYGNPWGMAYPHESAWVRRNRSHDGDGGNAWFSKGQFRGAKMASGGFVSTAYGPPWGGINGGGTTATGVDLHGSPHMYGVAVDPSVIPLGSNLSISPNPFGYSGPFKAFDTGGAIKGNRIDFYDWRGRSSQMGWGRRNVTVSGYGGSSSAKPAAKSGGGSGIGAIGASIGRALGTKKTMGGLRGNDKPLFKGSSGVLGGLALNPSDTSPGTYLTQAEQGGQSWIGAAQALASLTDDTGDDMAADVQLQAFWQTVLARVKKTGDPNSIADAANNLKSANDAITALKGSPSDQTDVASAMADLAAELKRHTDWMQNEMTVSAAAAWRTLADGIGGVVGNDLSVRQQTAGAGSVARY